MIGLVSPTSGMPLRQDGPNILTDGAERWPVVDGIPFLRTGREPLVRDAVSMIDHHDVDGALRLLLADQDDWWDGPAPGGPDLSRLVAERDRLSLREAMALLGYGRVGDYFAHRWSDPTFMAGCALIDAHWAAPRNAFELACGIGHYLRALADAQVAVAGGDVVFSKLWLARHWVVGAEADLVCFDAGSPWPIIARRFDLALCQDAFYFLEPKTDVLGRLRAICEGALVIGHVHNREAKTLSAGAAMSADEVARTFPDALVYDDDELTLATVEARVPVPRPPASMRQVEAFSLVERAGAPRAPDGPLGAPKPDRRYRRNPLYRAVEPGMRAQIVWPSERYGAEYGPRSTYPHQTDLPERPTDWTTEQVRRREVVALPERW